MALGLAACSPLFARQWIAVELQLMSSSVVRSRADRGCAIAADEGCGIVPVPVLRVRIVHEPVCGLRRCVPQRKGLHHLRLASGSLCPMALAEEAIEVSYVVAATALLLASPESPCLRLVI